MLLDSRHSSLNVKLDEPFVFSMAPVIGRKNFYQFSGQFLYLLRRPTIFSQRAKISDPEPCATQRTQFEYFDSK